jgi:hypothetical protein
MDVSRWLSRASMRLRALFRGAALDSELDEELRFHVDHLIEEKLARGLSPEAARREAMLAIGGMEQRKEECRDARRVRVIEDFFQDVRYAARTLGRSPSFSIPSILTLSLGIGATVAMFTVVYGILLRPLPFSDPDRLFLVALSPKSFFMRQPGMPDRTYVHFRDSDRSFQHLAAFSSYKGNLSGAGDPVVIRIGSVTTGVLRCARREDCGGAHLPAFRRAWRADGGDERSVVAVALRRRPGDRRQGHHVERYAPLRHRRHAAGLRFSERDRCLDAARDQDRSGQLAARRRARPPQAGCHGRAGTRRIGDGG